MVKYAHCRLSSVVEHFHGKEGVSSSSLEGGSSDRTVKIRQYESVVESFCCNVKPPNGRFPYFFVVGDEGWTTEKTKIILQKMDFGIRDIACRSLNLAYRADRKRRNPRSHRSIRVMFCTLPMIVF